MQNSGAAVTAAEAFTRHLGPVTCVAAVPGRPIALTSGYDGAVALFDLETRKAELLGYHGHLVNHIAVNRDGTKAASSSSDYEIYIWDLQTRRRERVLRGHSDDVDCFTFADGRRGVSSGQDRRVIIWDLDTGAIIRIIHEHEKDVISVVFHDHMIFSSGDDMTVRQWEIETGRLVRKWGPFEHEADTCAVDSVRERVVVGCDDGAIRIFDIAEGHLIARIDAHSSGIKKVATSPITGDILSAAYDQRMRIWSACDFSQLVELKTQPGVWERSLNWSPDGSKVLGGTFDGTIVVWDGATGDRLIEAGSDGPRGNACFNDISANESGDAVSVSDDGRLRMIHLSPSSAHLVLETMPASGPVLMNAVTLNDQLNMVVTGAHDHSLRIFTRHGNSLSEDAAVRLGEGPINCVRVSGHDGSEGCVFAACYSGAIIRVSRGGVAERRMHFHEGAVKALRIHPLKPIGISCSADGAICSWTLDGEILHRYPSHTSIADDVDLDPEGRLVASVSRDFTTRVFEFETGRLLHSIPIGHRSPKSVCFWDESTVLVGDYWGAIIRIDLTSGKRQKAQIGKNGFSSLSRTKAGVLASSYDGGIYLIEPAQLSVSNVFRAMTQRLDQSDDHSFSIRERHAFA